MADDGAEMKEDTLEYQLANCGGVNCTCAARGEGECACDADWTPAESYLLRHQDDALRKDAERYRWLRDRMAVEDMPEDHPAWSTPSEHESAAFDSAVDAAMRANA